MLAAVLIVIAVAMGFAASRHAIAFVRRERVLRQMHAAIEDAGKRHSTGSASSTPPEAQIER